MTPAPAAVTASALHAMRWSWQGGEMSTTRVKTLISAASMIFGLSILTGCSISGETTFDDIDELTTELESADYQCRDMARRPSQSDQTEDIEEIRCAEGHSLTVWGEEFEPDDRSSASDPMVADMEEQGLIEHLRGKNWHIMSIDGDMLEDLQQRLGGELNEQSFPNLDQ